MIRITTNTDGLEETLQKIAVAISDNAFDHPVERTAWRVQRDLVGLTPKGYTGNTRKNWRVTKPKLGQRIVINDSKVMRFLEGGTGHNTGGYIYPVTAKALFIPLNSRAALAGYQPGMKFGVDFVLAKRVRGIQAMRIVEKYKPKAQETLKEEVRMFIQKALK